MRMTVGVAMGIALGLLPVSAQVPTGVPGAEVPPPVPSWSKDFQAFRGTPRPLAYLAAQRAYETGMVLVQGVRPKDDRPRPERPVFGVPLQAGDWLLEDASGAIRVCGVPAPEPGRSVLLAGTLSVGEPSPFLRGLRWVASGRGEGTEVLRVGEDRHLPMPASKSTSCFPEFSGDTRALEVLFLPEGVVVRGVGQGTVTVRVFQQWWNRAEPEFLRTFTLKVVDRAD